MESWRALMTPIIGDSSEPNGFAAIVTSDPNPRTLSSSTMETIVIAALKAKPPYSWSKRLAIPQSCHLQSSHCRTLTTFQTERSLSSALSGVIESLISSENILNFLRLSSILMCELKLLPICIKFRSTLVRIWLLLSLTNYRHGSLQILRMGNRCIGTS
jgi:hypothetical protein